ncbi:MULTISPECIES: HupE/UreJ family protein [Nostocales]|jgi:urease accessory protein|uniref:Hydantoin utilization protein n=2 Tax=Aphanizomenonaceae TaxID=1892259 RepID=A0ACC7SD26_DOLFA|nr:MULTISPECIES: HupE/UreJ family protein [Nostocales]MBO1071772.1 hydantoin utilization protein [Dolichospermum sp. DEX189]MBD2280237.1 HupE/UreJ family protein [Aphanizomenon flos-aquae FACHB-1040]MBO1063659.1 hydantoin utilization protein [Anabaena sp. 54]MTJ46149.1 hydantoin utilization protein [Dolichospermum flos-aquae UHCC 0037]OBQ17584.1 MAG: hydantoin utilization protein [Anabaena sp. AL93]
MSKNSQLVASESSNLLTSKQQRLLGSIAILVVISLLTSAGGSPIEHNVSNIWEGFIWGIADPVISLDRFAGIVALGLFSARFTRGNWLNITFVIAAICGQLINLSPVILPAPAIAIAICTIALGVMLVTPIPIHWLAIALLSATAGIFQGYSDATSIIGAETLTMIIFVISVAFTQTVIIMSARKIGVNFGINEINQILPKIIRFAGLVFCAIGIVFLGYSII